MVVGEHGIQTFEVVVVVLSLLLLLSFDVFVPTSAHPLLFVDKWFVQIYLNVNFTVISLDVTYYIFACSFHCIPDKNSNQDGNSPRYCGSINGLVLHCNSIRLLVGCYVREEPAVSCR